MDKPTTIPRLLSLCSGIGCIDLAAVLAGFEIAGQVEIDPFCRQVLFKNFGDVPRREDIREVQGDEFGAIDVVAGGIPCQPFSSAGEQRGRDDDRYLWPEMFRVVKKCQSAWVVIENVDDFASMALDDVSADLETEGYEVQAFILPACAVGAPHIRERCFVVAYSSSNRWRHWQDQYQCQPWSVGLADARPHGEQGSLAHTQHGRCERWVLDADQPGATVLRSSSYTGAKLESRVGRDADGSAHWLDGHIWPALPGQAQHPQEPPRTIQSRQPYRNQRLKALGNGVVWQQVYPIFAAIMQCYEADLQYPLRISSHLNVTNLAIRQLAIQEGLLEVDAMEAVS